MKKEQLKACLVGGLIGDCVGSYFENNPNDYVAPTQYPWQITDDTQLSLATCQALIQEKFVVKPEAIAQEFLQWFQQRRLTGLGSSTLGALQALQVGGHWALAGRSGEFAAGNGAAMRIAPLAFVLTGDFDRHVIRDVVTITHKNDEAYCGALAVFFAIRTAFSETKKTSNNFDYCLNQLPDSNVKDALKTMRDYQFQESCQLIAQKYGSSGYVAESVPLAIYAAFRGMEIGFEAMMEELCRAGGDTDTTCSMAGQILATHTGIEGVPAALYQQAQSIQAYEWLMKVVEHWEDIT